MAQLAVLYDPSLTCIGMPYVADKLYAAGVDVVVISKLLGSLED